MKKTNFINAKQLSEIPEGEEQLQYIVTMHKALDAWADFNKDRGFIIIACGESNDQKGKIAQSSSCNMGIFGAGGNREGLCALIAALLRNNPDFQKFMTVAFKMYERDAKEKNNYERE